MAVDEVTVTVIYCDGHEDDPIGVTFENKFGEIYFEDRELDAVEQARADGWEIAGDRLYDAAWCPDCVAKRKRAEAGLEELPQEIPSQLDMFAEVAA